MPEISKPTETVHWIARNNDGTVLHSGTTEPDQVTTTGQPVFEQAASASEQLASLTTYVDKFLPLPEQGKPLLEGEIYQFEGELVKVRQSHTRTEHAPKDVPALFLWHRADGSKNDWVENERVTVGTIRQHGGQQYKCIQAHVTQAGWEPPNVPALWSLVVVTPTIAPWVQPTGGHDAYPLNAKVTHNGQTWQNTGSAANVWEPGVFGWVVVPS